MRAPQRRSIVSSSPKINGPSGVKARYRQQQQNPTGRQT